ncbi:DUF4399 domain-containing protein [Alcanivorax quisquiliarum]|uniref:DUF4399 domain-containing protein n=1 Tax=Alcanivorax quisquiliarum TaxID=2933565 RepID=A0ABT0E2U3_9GAMM|nr:DUF4399 domain-containing protein [Alcanivorax quisquiliarum]MCK0536135.1 DUF4399 domain-containing protein [Alcanivorax quisquiliarum]
MPEIHRNAAALLALAASALLLQACSDSPEPAQAPASAVEIETGGDDAHARHALEPQGLPRSTAPADARVFFIEPADGASVTSPVTLEFGLEGMDVVPAGTNKPDSGHHHLLINVTDLPPMDFPLPATEQVIHYGGGQTEATLELAPGEYRLQLVLGDHLHIPHDPPVMSDAITITVE